MRRALPLPVHPLEVIVAGAACAAAALVSPRAAASGFNIDEQSARATGRAGAIVASTRNASAIYYNPAGLGHTQGLSFELGTSVVAPSTSFVSESTGALTEADTQVFPLPHAYASYRANELVVLGIGVNAPYGLALEWPTDSPGRAIVREAELRTFFVMPVIAFDASEVAPGLSFGIGPDFVPSSVRLERDILFGEDTATVALGGNGFGVGGRAGISYRPPSLPVSFGLTYRSPVQLDFSGDADFDASPEYRASLPPDGPATTGVRLPASVAAGIALRPVPEWELETDVNWRGWSSYDTLVIELPAGEQSVAERNWDDAITLRIGTEYTFAQRWTARAGFIWDQTPVPDDTLDFQLPDANRIDVTLGFGAKLTDSVYLDVAALHVLSQTRATNDEPLEPPIKGEFEIAVWVFTASLAVTLDTSAD